MALPNGSAFNGRPGAEPRWNHKDRSARPVRCNAGSSGGRRGSKLAPVLLKRSGLNAGATQAPLTVIPGHFFRRKRVAGCRTGEWTKADTLHDHPGEEAEIEEREDQIPPSHRGRPGATASCAG